ncbi:MAG: hypothetical protein M3Q29_12540 [Chloroflexota bacterium]|nr:hypothetical protein [Chloroflexota bacterium]
MGIKASLALLRPLARVLAILALAITALPLSVSAQDADSDTTIRLETQAEAYWNNCRLADGTYHCTSSMIEIVEFYNPDSTGGGSVKRACFFASTHSFPAGDASAQGGGGGDGDTGTFEYGCTDVSGALKVNGLSTTKLSEVSIPLYNLVCQECERPEDRWEYSRDVKVAAAFEGTGQTSKGWEYHQRDPWYNDGCFQVDGATNEYRLANTDVTVDGKQMPEADRLWGFISQGTFNYTATCF